MFSEQIKHYSYVQYNNFYFTAVWFFFNILFVFLL